MSVGGLKAAARRGWQVASSTFVVASFGRVVVQVLAAATVLVAARYVDLAGFGTFALASAVAVIAVTLLNTGFFQQILRTREIEAERDTLFWIIFAIGMAGSAVMAVVGIWLSLETKIGLLFLLLSPVPVLAAPAAFFEAILIRDGRVRSTVLATVFAEFSGFVAMMVAFSSGQGVFALAASRLVATVIALIIKALQVSSLPGLKFDFAKVRAGWGEARALYGTTTTDLASNYGADLILGFFLNPLAVGTYRAGARVAVTVGDIFAQPLGAISWSRFARHERQNEQAEMRQTWLSQMRFSTVVAWPALVCLSFLAEPFVTLLLSDVWVAAAPVLAVLAIAHAIAILDVASPAILVCLGHGNLLLAIRATAAVLMVALFVVTAPFGPKAVALAFLATKLMATAVTLYLIKKKMSVPSLDLISAVVPGAVLTAVCFGVVLMVENLPVSDSGLLTFLLAGLVGATVWAVALAGLLLKKIVEVPVP